MTSRVGEFLKLGNVWSQVGEFFWSRAGDFSLKYGRGRR